MYQNKTYRKEKATEKLIYYRTQRFGETKKELEDSNEFRNYIGDILTEILEDQEAQIGNARHTDDNTEIIDE